MISQGECVEINQCVYEYGPLDSPAGCLPARYSEKRLIPSYDDPDLTHIDWRDWGVVTPVRDQGDCNGSWAIAIIGAVESFEAIVNGPLHEFSEQNLINCVFRCGCWGGDSYKTYAYLAQSGYVLRDLEPYTALD